MKAARRQFLVSTFAGTPAVRIAGYFATADGGDPVSAATVAWDGGSRVPEKLTGPPVPEDLTIGRPFDPIRDQPIIKALLPLVGKWLTNVQVQPTDPDLVPQGPSTTYNGCKLLRVTAPKPDASSGDPAPFQLVFSVSSVA